jgi:hypothetical protein
MPRKNTDQPEWTFAEIIEQLSDTQKFALLTDERAVENLPFQDRDQIIWLGLARRAWPRYTGDKQWRTWLTPLGVSVRNRLAPEHYDTECLVEATPVT